MVLMHALKTQLTSLIDAFASTSIVCFSLGVLTMILIFFEISCPSAILISRWLADLHSGKHFHNDPGGMTSHVTRILPNVFDFIEGIE